MQSVMSLMLMAFLLAMVQDSWAMEYVVDARHPQASDENPGTAERPFRTISKAAQIVKSGDTVIIKAGVYRESVRLERSGTP